MNVGRPSKILSDNGSQYTSRLSDSTLESENICAIHSSVRHPQSNPSERVMREIGRLIRTYCHEKHTAWADYLPTIQHWLNMTVHSSTNMTPKDLHFGNKQNQDLGKSLTFPPNVNIPIDKDTIVGWAREEMLKQATNRQKRHNNKHKCISLELGDLVLLKDYNQSSALDKTIKKFFLLYKGPYRIDSVVGPNA